MVAFTSTSATSSNPTLQRKEQVISIDMKEEISVDTVSLCSEDFEEGENSECSDTSPEQVLRSPRKAASASHIRSRFLNRLGISKPTKVKKEELSKVTSSGPCSGSFSETLKADYGKRDNTLAARASPLASVASFSFSKKRSVRFAVEVAVHPIPSWSRYSDRIRSTIWTPTAEIHANAARNSYEFCAEGCDWRFAAENEDMVMYAGELVHPIHFVQEPEEFSMRRQFLQVMSVQNH
jgi:hypothetical protein